MAKSGKGGFARWLVAIAFVAGMVSAAPAGAEGKTRRVRNETQEAGTAAYIVSLGLFGAQSVFESEAKGAARALTGYFHSPYRPYIRYNSKHASQINPATMMDAMNKARSSINPDKDILVLFLTSHGTPAGVAVAGRNGTGTLSPSSVGNILQKSGARYRILIVSACYSGVFANTLADRDTLVITAAASDRTSFGCADRVRWTYFGEAFFQRSLRPGRPLSEVFAAAREIIQARETAEGHTPSNPQFRGGEAVLKLLGQ